MGCIYIGRWRIANKLVDSTKFEVKTEILYMFCNKMLGFGFKKTHYNQIYIPKPTEQQNADESNKLAPNLSKVNLHQT